MALEAFILQVNLSNMTSIYPLSSQSNFIFNTLAAKRQSWVMIYWGNSILLKMKDNKYEFRNISSQFKRFFYPHSSICFLNTFSCWLSGQDKEGKAIDINYFVGVYENDFSFL